MLEPVLVGRVLSVEDESLDNLTLVDDGEEDLLDLVLPIIESGRVPPVVVALGIPVLVHG